MNLFRKIFGRNSGNGNAPKVDPNLRVRFKDFTIAYFDKVPVWEFASDEEGAVNQDETTLRPTNLSVGDPGEGMQIVKAVFKTPSGQTFYGVCSTAFEYNLGAVQPHIFCEGGLFPFWFGLAEPADQDIQDFYRLIEMSAETFFPLSFKSLTKTKGAELSGQIEGFMFLDGEYRVKVKK